MIITNRQKVILYVCFFLSLSTVMQWQLLNPWFIILDLTLTLSWTHKRYLQSSGRSSADISMTVDSTVPEVQGILDAVDNLIGTATQTGMDNQVRSQQVRDQAVQDAQRSDIYKNVSKHRHCVESIAVIHYCYIIGCGSEHRWLAALGAGGGDREKPIRRSEERGWCSSRECTATASECRWSDSTATER